MLQNDLYNWLTNTAEVQTLFPGGVHHLSLPQDVSVWPSMSFFQVSHVEIGNDMGGPFDEKLDQVQYQFDIVADNSSESIATGEEFLRIFRNFRGTMATTRIQGVELANISHQEDRRGDKIRRRVSIDFSITYDVTE